MGECSLLWQGGGTGLKVNETTEYMLLADYTVGGSAVTRVDFANVDASVDDELVLVVDLYNSSASTSRLSPYFNRNTTTTNYYNQFIAASGTSITSGRENLSTIAYQPSGVRSMYIVPIKLTNNGYIVWQVNSVDKYGTPSGVEFVNNYCTSTFTSTSIGNIALVSSVSNAIGIGSRFQLYKINGGAIQTWELT